MSNFKSTLLARWPHTYLRVHTAHVLTLQLKSFSNYVVVKTYDKSSQSMKQEKANSITLNCSGVSQEFSQG